MRFRVLFYSLFFFVFAIPFPNPAQAQTISGSIRDAGDSPIHGAVRIYDASGTESWDFWVDGEGNFQTEAAENGTYYAVTVHTGEMLDKAWNDIPCENLVCDITGTTPIVVDGGDVSGIDFILSPFSSGGRISGTVEDASNLALADVGIEIRNINGEHLFQISTDPDGSYQTQLVSDDTYFVVTSEEPFGLGRVLYDNYPCLPANACGDPAVIVTNGTPVVVASADEPGIDFLLEIPSGGMISGQVTDAETGIVMPDVHMNLLTINGDYLAHTNTDPQGNYYFSGLANGSYKVYAVRVPHGYTGELYGGDPCQDWNCDLPTLGAPIVISNSGEVSGKDIELDYSGTRLLGTVTRSDTGDPVSSQYAHIGIDLFSDVGDHMGTWPTNRAGQYQIELAAGSYYLVALNDWDYHGLINEAWDDIKCPHECDPLTLGASLIAVGDGTTVVANFELDPGFRLSGMIRAEGAPTDGGHVNIWDFAGQHVTAGGNDGTGNWRSEMLVAGTYYATARGEDFGMISQLYDSFSCPQEYCDVTSGTPINITDSDITGIDFDLDPSVQEWRISGSIRDPDSNLVYGVVRITDPFGNIVFDVGTDHEANFQGWQLANGTYFAVTLHTHEMLDEAWENFLCENLMCDITSSTPILVDGGDAGGIDFVLSPISVGGRISGQVKDGSDVAVPYVGIAVRNGNGEFLFDLGAGPDGTYQTAVLANDTYYVHTANEPFGLGGELYDNHPCGPANMCNEPAFIKTNGDAVTINGSDRPGIDFTLVIPPGGMISGQVTDADTGFVMPDVHMNLLTVSGDYLAHTSTDPMGNFYFSGLADGSYKIYAVGVPYGYTGELYGGDHCQEWNCDLSTSGMEVVIDGGALVSGRNIMLDFSGTRILGNITRSDTHDPVSSQFAHMGVDLFSDAGDYIETWPTNLAGQYQIDLAHGTYYLVATNDWDYHGLINEAWNDIKCYDCNPIALGATQVVVADGASVIADFELDPGYKLSGTIRAEGVITGEGEVTIWSAGGSKIRSEWNDGGGNWTTPPMLPGTYYATVRGEYFGMVSQLYENIPCPQEFCDVTGGTAITVTDSKIEGIDFDLVPISADWTVSGSIRDIGGNPVNGAVRFFDPLGNILFHTFVDDLGNFQTGPMADGSYFAITMLTFEMIDEAWDDFPCQNRVCDVTGTTPIVVAGGDVNGIDFVLDPLTVGGHISGRIEDSSHTPLADVGIVVRNANGAWLFRTSTGPDGTYETRLLANATYFLHTRNEPFGLGRELYDDIPCLPFNNCGNAAAIAGTATPVIVDGADETGIDFGLEVPAGGMITGLLTDADTGIPLPDVHLVLIDSFHDQVTGTFSGAVGDYYFSGLDDGDYKVYADGVPEGYTGEFYGGDHCPDWSCDIATTGIPITVNGGAVVDGRNIVLDFSGTRILGTVIRSDTAEPVASTHAEMRVDLFSDSGEYLGEQQTNRAGQFQLNLDAGSYYLVATGDWNYHGLISEAWDDVKCYGECDPVALGADLIHVTGDTTVVANFVLDPEVVFKNSFE